MKYNTRNKKIASITEKTLIIGIDVGSQIHYARAFGWRNYEYLGNHLHSAMTNSAFWRLRKAWMRLLKSIIRKP